MRFSNPLLSAHLKTGRIAHTYLFTGPEGAAKSELILAFARALNCEKGSDPKKGSDPFCACASCRKTGNRNHPDVRWMGEDEKSRSIKIEEIRTLIHEAWLKPYEGKWKVFILKGAERLTLEAANALLKTLEEPPEHSVFILLAENKAHLLETIQSRSLEIRTPSAPEKNPLEDPVVQRLHEKGPGPFFESLRANDRQTLSRQLEKVMLYLRDRSAETFQSDRLRSQKYLQAIEKVYETQQAVDDNVNQKLALTRLEIHLEKLLK